MIPSTHILNNLYDVALEKINLLMWCILINSIKYIRALEWSKIIALKWDSIFISSHRSLFWSNYDWKILVGLITLKLELIQEFQTFATLLTIIWVVWCIETLAVISKTDDLKGRKC